MKYTKTDSELRHKKLQINATALIIMFSAVVLFQLVTLPVEFDASNRALKTLENDCILESDELGGAKKVLKAAAMTYVTALVVSIIQLLRLLASAKRR